MESLRVKHLVDRIDYFIIFCCAINSDRPAKSNFYDEPGFRECRDVFSRGENKITRVVKCNLPLKP